MKSNKFATMVRHTDKVNLMMVDDMADERATVIENDFVKLGDFLKNPYNNVRDLEKQVIEITDDGSVRLKSDLDVDSKYREKFNEVLDSLIEIETDVDGNKHYYFKALQPFIVSPKNNKSYPNKWVLIDGNTRYFILCQLIELVGEDNVDFTISYKIFKDWNEVATLLSAPGMGYNSSIPVLKQSAESVLNSAYEYIQNNPDQLKEGQEGFDWVKENIVASAKKSGVNKNIFGWWKVLQQNPSWLDFSDKMNLEVAYYLIKYQDTLSNDENFKTFYNVDGEAANDKAFEILKQEVIDYAENTRGRLTTKRHVNDIKESIESLFVTADNQEGIFGDPTGTGSNGIDGTPDPSNGPQPKKPKIDLIALAESSDKSPESLLEDILSECLDGVITTQSTKWVAYDENEMSAVYSDLLAVKKILNRVHNKLSPDKGKTKEGTEASAETTAA